MGNIHPQFMSSHYAECHRILKNLSIECHHSGLQFEIKRMNTAKHYANIIFDTKEDKSLFLLISSYKNIDKFYQEHIKTQVRD